MSGEGLILPLAGLAGAAVCATSGALAAGRKRLDLIGASFLACATALGGGTLRDLLLDRHPVFWVERPAILWTTLAATVLALLWVRFARPPWRALQVADALGLAFFTISGAQVAEAAGQGGVIVVVMGLLTGVAGGVIRDVLAGEIPLLFRPTEPLYATSSLSGVTFHQVGQRLGLDPGWAALGGMGLVLALRLGAVVLGWRLPALELKDGAS